MYAILVNEPGGETKSFILGTAASTPKAAIQLMFTRAEEFISEQLELETEGAEDYIIEAHDQMNVIVYDSACEDHSVVLLLEATAITEVVS